MDHDTKSLMFGMFMAGFVIGILATSAVAFLVQHVSIGFH